tara:strand:- start:354 stop:515 length:162 start_codon:yes stop_codon:yes gene_type:complete
MSTQLGQDAQDTLDDIDEVLAELHRHPNSVYREFVEGKLALIKVRWAKYRPKE